MSKVAGRRGHRSRRGQQGFSLLEILIAMTVLSIGLLVVAQMIPTASAWGVATRNMNQATEMSQSVMERLKALPYNSVWLSAGTHVDTLNQRIITYTIQDDIPVAGTKRIDLTLSWVGAKGARQVALASTITQ